jgi:hypothetical protein
LQQLRNGLQSLNVAGNNTDLLRYSFNPYPANVENMVSS